MKEPLQCFLVSNCSRLKHVATSLYMTTVLLYGLNALMGSKKGLIAPIGMASEVSVQLAYVATAAWGTAIYLKREGRY